MKIFKKVTKSIYFVSCDLIKLVIVLLRATLTLNFRSTIIRKVRNNPLFILGNGPSLHNIRASITNRNEVSLCTVNFSVLTDVFYELKPEFHVFADGAFFYGDISQVNDVYDALLNRVEWDIELIVPLSAKKIVQRKLSKNTHIIVRGVCGNVWIAKSVIMKPFQYFLFSKNFVHPPFQNVCVSCIFNGINMGFKQIELYGVEHSWTKHMIVREDNVVCFKDEHF